MVTRSAFAGQKLRMEMKLIRAASKVAIKYVLLSLAPYQFWKSKGFFAHGKMDIPSYVQLTIEKLNLDCEINSHSKYFIELGPGDSAAISDILLKFGHKTLMIEDGSYIPLEKIPSNATYLTGGVESFKNIPDESVDIIFSHAVLEHVCYDDLTQYFSEWSRTLRPGGKSVHLIDIRDHMTGGLQNRVLKRILGDPLYTKIMKRAYLYTNGLSASQYISLAAKHKFTYKIENKILFKSLNSIERKFDDDGICELTIVFKK